MPAIGDPVWIQRRKWKNSPHYGSEGVFLGEDEHGRWLGAQPGNRMYKGTGPILRGKYPVVWCVPSDGWFLAHYLIGHPDLEIYVDVAAPAVWSDRSVKIVDLDLDVIVWKDGRPVELVDEDEFERHRVELGYPEEVATAARVAATRILASATAAAAPFNTDAAARWFDVVDTLKTALDDDGCVEDTRAPDGSSGRPA
jgi:protein associated with RNAse G/E